MTECNFLELLHWVRVLSEKIESIEVLLQQTIDVSKSETRLMATSNVLSGLLSNPNVIGQNPNCGWSVVNGDLEGLLILAKELVACAGEGGVE